MFRKLREKNARQAARIRELEELICPNGQHKWVRIDSCCVPGIRRGSKEFVHTYACQHCKRKKEADM